MRVSKEQAAENRRRIVEVAGTLFREKGFNGIGVADLMKEAGLTHGSFHGRFASKDDLAAEACAEVRAGMAARWVATVEGAPEEPLRAIAAFSLSAVHPDHPGKGCPIPALGSEVARQDGPVRRVFIHGVRALGDVLAGIVPGRSAAVRRERALAALAGMVGAVMLARAVDDPELSDDIMAAVASTLGAK